MASNSSSDVNHDDVEKSSTTTVGSVITLQDYEEDDIVQTSLEKPTSFTDSFKRRFGSEKCIQLSLISHLAISFCFLFSCYTTTQSLVTKVFVKDGRAGLSVLYLMFSISCFIAPVAVHKFGLRICLTIASLLYVNFVIACILGNVPYYYIACFGTGCAASFLWVSQGVFLSRTAKKEWIGQATGLFYSILSFSGIVGNLIIGPLLVVSNESNSNNLITSLWVLTSLGFFAVVLLLLIRSPGPSDTEKVMSIKQRLISTFTSAKEKKMMFLIPCIFYQGASDQSGSFSFGVLSPLLDVKLIPFVFVTYSFTVIIASSIFGRVYDKFSWKPLLLWNVINVMTAYSIMWMGLHWRTTWLVFVAAIFLGTLDSQVNTLMNSTLSKHFLSDPAGAFSVYRVVKSLGTSIALFVEGYLTFELSAVMLIAFSIVSVTSYVFMQRVPSNVDSVATHEYEMVHTQDDSDQAK